MGKRGDLQRKRVAAVVSGYYILVIVLLVILAQANIFLPKHSFAVFGLAFIFIPSFLYYLYTIQALVVTDEKRSRSNNNNHTSKSLHVNISSTPAPAETEKNSHHKQVEKISTPSLKPVSDQTPIFKINNPYANLLDPLVDKMLDYCNLDTHPSGSSPDDMFQTIVTQSSSRGNFSVEIAKLKGHDFFFRVVCDMETTPETAFDILSDIDRRKEWDEVVSKSGVVAKIAPGVSIQYMISKAMWPTSGREALVASVVKRLPDGRYLNVTSSVHDYPSYTSDPACVRMDAKIAGQIVGPHPSKNPNLCRVIQLIDGDLKGWIPKALVALITTKAMPFSLRRVNKMMREEMPKKQKSDMISEAESGAVMQINNISNAPTVPASEASPQSASAALQLTLSNISNNNQQSKQDAEDMFTTVTRTLQKIQPWLVAFIFISTVLNRKRA